MTGIPAPVIIPAPYKPYTPKRFKLWLRFFIRLYSIFCSGVNNQIICKIPIEVKSQKIDYKTQYPAMIADLSEIASGLIYEFKSPLYQMFKLNSQINKTKYEDFMILEYIFLPENLPSTFEYLSKNLYSNLEEYTETIPAPLATNIGPNELIDIISYSQDFMKINSENTIIYDELNGYIPREINEIQYKDNVDTPENRFYKYFLEILNYHITDCLNNVNDGYVKEKLLNFKDETYYYLSQKYFQDISKMDYAPFNSQVLQKKEGYRDIFQYFLMLEFSFKLQWDEITNNFRGYEKKLSQLYEYWCYFKLIKILEKITNTKIKFEDIYDIDENGWSLKLNENKKSIIQFNYNDLKIELLYTKKFNKNTIDKSYSLNFKPDYTIIIKTNNQRYLVHFDAKYKVNTIPQDDENKISIYKHPDIYKMHTYKDALFNTIGSYILYPGNISKVFKENNDFIYPSIGAFPLNPGSCEKEENLIYKFLKDILNEIQINN